MREHTASGIGAALGLVVLAGCGPAPGWEDRDPYAHVRAERKIVVTEEEATSAADRGSLVGRWIGVGEQSDGHGWKVDLDVTHLEEGPCAIVRYPDVGCAGYWTCESVSRGGRIRAVERITQGQDKCVDGVAIDAGFTKDGEQLVFEADTGTISASARLVRADED